MGVKDEGAKGGKSERSMRDAGHDCRVGERETRKTGKLRDLPA
jgi:hypothetical protein